MIQFEIDLLNKAQQQLAQACVEDQFPKSFSGTVPIPTTVAYPSGVLNATFSPSGPIPSAPAVSVRRPALSLGCRGNYVWLWFSLWTNEQLALRLHAETH